MELVVVEVFGCHDVRPATVLAAKKGRGRRATGTDRKQPRWLGLIEPDVIADNPQVLGAGVAWFPAIEILTVEQGLPTIASREAFRLGLGSRRDGRTL